MYPSNVIWKLICRRRSHKRIANRNSRI